MTRVGKPALLCSFAPLSLFFDDLLDAKVRKFNPRYAEAIGWTIVSREEAEKRRAGFPTRHEGENAGRNARAPLTVFLFETYEATKGLSCLVFATESPLKRQKSKYATKRQVCDK